jgi:hypothetical protein
LSFPPEEGIFRWPENKKGAQFLGAHHSREQPTAVVHSACSVRPAASFLLAFAWAADAVAAAALAHRERVASAAVAERLVAGHSEVDHFAADPAVAGLAEVDLRSVDSLDECSAALLTGSYCAQEARSGSVVDGCRAVARCDRSASADWFAVDSAAADWCPDGYPVELAAGDRSATADCSAHSAGHRCSDAAD